MSSKAFSLFSIIPHITSVTKTTSGKSVSRNSTNRAGAAPRSNVNANANASTRASSSRAFSAAATAGRSRVYSNTWVSRTSAICLALIAVGLGFYIYAINASVSKGYELKAQQAQMDELLETQKRLLVQESAMGSIVKVSDVAATAGMVPITGEEFLVANQLSSR